MDAAERLVAEYLKLLGHRDIVFEPLGPSTFPDFCVNGRIGVEVRRLDQHERQSGSGQGPIGLKTRREGLKGTIKDVLQEFGPPTSGPCWFVNLRFRRPVPRKELVRKKLHEFLSMFQDDLPEECLHLTVGDTVHFSLRRSSTTQAFRFLLGGISDGDTGGWVVPELEANLAIAIQDKSSRLAAHRGRFEEWWLVLVDYINSGDPEKLQVPPHDWDKLILLDPQDPSRAYEP